jgi:hypothetical protein
MVLFLLKKNGEMVQGFKYDGEYIMVHFFFQILVFCKFNEDFVIIIDYVIEKY